MSADQLVYDMASAPTETPSVFVKRDYFSVLDDQNGQYAGNQSVLQLSSLANSNRYMDFKNSYITMPLVLSMTADGVGTAFTPSTNNDNFAIGLKNWFAHIIHSVQCDFNNSTAQQLTSFQSILNCFKLHTTLSWDDVRTQGSSIGYYPDNATSWGYDASVLGLENSNNKPLANTPLGNKQALGNEGLFKRQQSIAYDPTALTEVDAGNGDAASTIFTATNASNMYRSHVFNKVDGAAAVVGTLQLAITAKIMSKHISDFLAKLPLVKGAFVKLTLNLNSTSATLTHDGTNFTAQSVNCPLGGVNPILVAGSEKGYGVTMGGADTLIVSLGVGRNAPSSANHPAGSVIAAPLATSVEFHCPAVTFAPIFESAYLSAAIKRFSYEDFYNYNIINQTGRITELLTNGVANQSRIVVCPFLNSTSNNGTSPFQSCFTTDGATTSPVQLNEFNILLSGANVLQQNYRYTYEMFLEQLKGTGAVNGGVVDGVTSGQIDQLAFENIYAYHVVDTSRMLEVEKAVPKSVQLLAQIQASSLAVDLYTFICYKMDFAVDVLTGARV
jgi:hypothetical protein